MQRLAPAPVPAGPPAGVEATQESTTGAADSAHAQLLRRCIAAAAEALMGAAAELDALDRAVGDGDCGSTLATAAKAIKQVALEPGTLNLERVPTIVLSPSCHSLLVSAPRALSSFLALVTDLLRGTLAINALRSAFRTCRGTL